MSGPPRVPVTIRILPDGSTKSTRPTFVPAAREAVSVDDVADAAAIARQLNSMQSSLAETTFATRCNPHSAPVTFENITCNATGATNPIRLEHGLGRYVKWSVVGWRGAAGGHSIVEDLLDAGTLTTTTTLVLKSFVAGTADIEVW